MQNALQYSHELLKKLVQKNPNGLFIDATLGNGHDSYFLLSLKDFKGHLIGFDIQNIALQNALMRVQSLDNQTKGTYEFHLDSHENITQYLDDNIIEGAIFNLGYLPGGDHSLTTTFESTYNSIQAILQNMSVNGQIILVIYSGHANGMIEKVKLIDELSKLSQENFQVLSYQFLNQKNTPPMLLVIERIK